MVQVKTFYAHNELRNFSYLIFDDQTGSAWVIDPYDADPLSFYIKKNHLNLKGILNTHSHFDHIRGNAPLQQLFGAGVKRLGHSEKLVLDSQHLLQTLDSPGHTLDHQVFVWHYEQNPRALFSGDTLFNAGVGNCKNGGDVNLLYQTTKQLVAALPADTLLYPGHDYRQKNLQFAQSFEPDNTRIRDDLALLAAEVSFDLPPLTLGEEKEMNPFLRLDSEEIAHHLNVPSDHDDREQVIFKKLRTLRDNF